MMQKKPFSAMLSWSQGWQLTRPSKRALELARPNQQFGQDEVDEQNVARLSANILTHICIYFIYYF